MCVSFDHVFAIVVQIATTVAGICELANHTPFPTLSVLLGCPQEAGESGEPY